MFELAQLSIYGAARVGAGLKMTKEKFKNDNPDLRIRTQKIFNIFVLNFCSEAFKNFI